MRRLLAGSIHGLVAALLTLSFHACALAAPVPAGRQQQMAERALMQGHLDEAVDGLRQVVAAEPHNAAAQLLLCRAFFAEEQLDQAISACQSAVQADPNRSDAQDWLGRAYGIKAGRSGLLSGFQLARKVKTALEAAVQLDPSNGAAVNDLSEFYISAPAVIGGGVDKARALAARVAPRLPQQAHRIAARIAEKESDFGTAEREFRAAVAVANRPDAWADLAAFYGDIKQYDKAVEAARQCFLADRARDASIVDVASTLNDIHRDPQMAEQALREYLNGPSRSDAAPAPKVEVMLARTLAAGGNDGGAKIELNKALQLASQYDPARQELQALQHG